MDHNRIEIRECWTLLASFYQASLRNVDEWEKLTSLDCICLERRLGEKTQVETRYSIVRYRPMPTASCKPSMSTGTSKIRSIGCWMSPSMKN